MKATVIRKVPKLRVLDDASPERVETLRVRDPSAYAALLAASDGQARANEAVERALDVMGVEAHHVDHDRFDVLESQTDIVIVVGGDGTVLDVSHRVIDVPLLGVNSDPVRSVGYFCGTDAAGVAEALARVAAGQARSCLLRRIAISVDGKPFDFPCMNDLLVTNRNPAMMSRYILRAGARSETHASSGVWISTPAGSTAGIRSAGGTVMPLEGALIQYLVREPYLAGDARYPLLRGVRHLSEGLSVRSLMDGGMVYMDGPHIEIPFPLGAELALSEGPPIKVVEMDPIRRER